jgi:ribosomal protein S18 acetylase RimI-like enzyme
MTKLLTLVASASPGAFGSSMPPDGYALRPCRAEDVRALGRLYFEAYDPGEACASLVEAETDIRATYEGEYGELWPAASLVALVSADPVGADVVGADVVGAVQVVRRAPWPDTPDCPFVIELFTDRAHRRRGLARALVRGAMAVVGPGNLALRVRADNEPALALYRDLGFVEWSG